jgi:glutamate formiminotransferase / 5-formyltetrahydrofolate cyclo-ligase
VLECVINVSEGRRSDVIDTISGAAGDSLLDVHRDADHHRSVITVVGEEAARAVAAAAVAGIDLTGHDGAHPRMGAVDVVPFVPIASTDLGEALAARGRFATWAGSELGVPCFLYGPERTLPQVRRTAFTDLTPDTGPPQPHPSAGATAVGARPVLVAYNVWLAQPDLDLARRIAARLRGPAVRALGLAVGEHVQVSMNLLAPDAVGPAEVYDAVAMLAPVARAELVGLLPAAVLDRADRHRWTELDLADDRTIESRLERAGQR